MYKDYLLEARIAELEANRQPNVLAIEEIMARLRREVKDQMEKAQDQSSLSRMKRNLADCNCPAGTFFFNSRRFLWDVTMSLWLGARRSFLQGHPSVHE